MRGRARSALEQKIGVGVRKGSTGVRLQGWGSTVGGQTVGEGAWRRRGGAQRYEEELLPRDSPSAKQAGYLV